MTSKKIAISLGLAVFMLGIVFGGRGGELAALVDQTTSDFTGTQAREPQSVSRVGNVFNLIAHQLPTADSTAALNPCLPDSTYTVPRGVNLLVTDVFVTDVPKETPQTPDQGELFLWTDQRGVLTSVWGPNGRSEDVVPLSLNTPLVILSGEKLCLFLHDFISTDVMDRRVLLTGILHKGDVQVTP